MLAIIDQPTSRREKSITADRYSHPSAVQMYVKSAIHFWVRPLGRKLPVQKVRRHGCDLVIAFVLRGLEVQGPWAAS